MKKTYLLLSLCLCFLFNMAAFAQGQYQINGHIDSEKKVEWAYLYSFNPVRKLIDSVQVHNNRFRFEGKIDQPLAASIGLKGLNRSVQFFLESAPMEAYLYEDRNAIGTVIGGEQNAIKKSFEGEVQAYQDSLFALGRLYEHADEEGKVKVGMAMQQWTDKMDTIRQAYVKSYPGSLAVLDMYRPYFPILNFMSLQKLVQQFDPKLAYSALYQELLKAYEAKKARNLVGQQAPQISSKTLSGKNFDLKALKGKVVLIDFWASWCAPCRIANRKLVPTYEQYKGKGFEIVSVSMDAKEQLWKDAVKKDGIPWIQVADLIDLKTNPAAAAYHVEQLPTLFLLDEQGIVIQQNINHEELIQFLKTKYDE